MIQRYLTDAQWKKRKDFQFLADMARRSQGRLQFFIRMNRVVLYHQGNIVCTLHLSTNPYQIKFSRVFFERAFPDRSRPDPEMFLGLPLRRTTSAVCLEGLTARQVKKVLTRPVIEEIMGAIRWRDYGHEIAFEQLLMHHNPPRPEFIIIDRQVSDTGLKKRRMDVLALRRVGHGGNRYRICVIEIKLGGSRDLGGRVVEQLRGYAEHIRGEVANAYRESYERLYVQLRTLGLLRCEGLADNIEILPDVVEGIIVVGYSRQDDGPAIEAMVREERDIRVVEIGLGLQ